MQAILVSKDISPITVTESGSVIVNTGSVFSEPVITVYDSGGITLMVGTTIVELTGITDSITLDTPLMEAYSGIWSLNGYMSGDFPVLKPGMNAISWSGNVASESFSQIIGICNGVLLVSSLIWLYNENGKQDLVGQKLKRGKRMSRPIKRATIAVALAFILFLSFSILPINTTKKFDINEYSYGADFSIELDQIPVVEQQTGHTCYAVSMVIARTSLGLETTENELLAELRLQDRSSGMLPRAYLPFAQEALGAFSYSITLRNPKSETEILNLITGSLTEGFPVVIYYSTMDDWNKPRYNTHYGVIYGVDMKKHVVQLSNPYGYLDELPFEEFFKGLAFDNYENEPFFHRLGRVTGYIKSNNLFLLEHTE